MLELSIPIKLLLSLLIGSAIGLERESYDQFQRSQNPKKPKESKGSLGVRTFSLITTLGTLAGLLRADFPDLFMTINIVFLVLLVAYYITGSIYLQDNGITTEMAIIFSYLIGVFIALEIFPIQIILAVTVVLILILSQKQVVRQWISDLQQSEIRAFISYSIIALVILPFLPNQTYGLNDLPGLSTVINGYNLQNQAIFGLPLFNPYRLWLIVALITGVEILGYLLSKVLGQKKGWLLASFVAGFVSSTSTTVSLAQKSRHLKATNKLVAAAILANLASFLQLFILIAALNSAFLVKSTTVIVAIIVASLICALWFLKQKDQSGKDLNKTDSGFEPVSIFSLHNALSFVIIYMTISAFSKVALVIFGEVGFYVTASLAALTGIDAMVITLSSLVGSSLSYSAGIFALILINAINLSSKAVYAFMIGNKEFAIKLTAAMIVVILASFLGIL